MFRALVVEDQNLMRLALMEQIQGCIENCIVLGAETLELATRELSKDNYDLVVVDPGLPGIDPTAVKDRVSVVDKIIQASPSAIHVVVTGSDSDSESQECRRLGAAGYLGKTGLEPGVFREVLKDISTKGFSIRLSRIAMATTDYRYSGLTPREQQIVDMMVRRERGTKKKTIYEIMSDRLGIDAATSEKYYKQARAKLLRIGHRLPNGL
ncbi:response regulator [Mesorhizobium sp. NPDC059025]|uniref:response regulator n=1 Tax=unclassified Mesorhizobium TaxID=325217 RepID=UPI0036AF7B7C